MDASPEKKSADYKAEEEQEQCSKKAWEEEDVSPEDREAIGSMAKTKKEGQEKDEMATYDHLQQRAFLHVL